MNWGSKVARRIQETRIPHRNYLCALDHLLASISVASPGQMICLTGPSRVGKSRLSQEIGALITGNNEACGDEIPVMTVVAENDSKNGSFSTKSFTLLMLTAVKHPFYSRCNEKDAFDHEFDMRMERTSESTLKRALERAMMNRKVKYLVIDEAHHVLYAYGGEKSAAAFYDSLKCLAQKTKCVILLVGAYPLLYALQHCTHMLGRKHQLHFPRYLETDKNDRKSFKEILATYSAMVPISDNLKTLISIEDLLYQETFGCIGLLELSICEAIADAIAKKSDSLSLENFTRTMRPSVEIQEIACEIEGGEIFLASREHNCPSPPQKENNATGAPDIKGTRKHAKSSKKGKPFQAKPRRYPIGGRS